MFLRERARGQRLHGLHFIRLRPHARHARRARLLFADIKKNTAKKNDKTYIEVID